MFEELSHIVIERHPDLQIEGDTYPPPAWRSYLAQFMMILKMATIVMTVCNLDPFPLMGLPTPRIVQYAHQNKVSFCLMTFFVGNIIEGQLLSTGAFEIYYNDMPIWSKLQSQRIPQPDELLQIITNQQSLFSNSYPSRMSSPASHLPRQ